jgi:hypothetical protein
MKVWNKRDKNIPSDAIYVGRPSKWGNPYKITRNVGVPAMDRNQAIDLYRKWIICRIAIEPDFIEPLKGKDLVCWCAPLPCHADVLLELANG